MANTYYDSQLTAEEIEEVLEAINGILTSANNGKVLAISNGKLEARSVQWGGGEAVLEPLSITENGDYYPESGVDGFDEVHVDVSGGGGEIVPAIVTPSSVYAAGFEGDKAFGTEVANWWGSNSASQGYLKIDFINPVKITRVRFHNTYIQGSYHWSDSRVVFQYSDDGSAWVDLFDKQNLPDSMDNETVETIQNPSAHRYYRFLVYSYGTFYTGLGRVQFSVSGGGGGKKGFEVYAADAGGGARTERGWYNNDYFVCFFDDNMSSTYSLNGVSATYSTTATGKQQILATTRDVVNSQEVPINGFLPKDGSVFTASHGDTGSYISVVGGWVGYPSGGAIYESASVGTSNSVTLNSAYDTLLIFIGASSDTSGITTIDINGGTYTIENIGYHYGAYGMYTAIEINGNSGTNITVTFPASCWSYVSIIGLNN